MVLVLEDDKKLRNNLNSWFEIKNIPYITYNHSKKLLSDLQNNLLSNIDIAIIDIAGTDGKETIPLLREKFPNAVIIIFTGYSDMGGSYLRYNVDHYIKKSELDKLLKTITEHVNR